MRKNNSYYQVDHVDDEEDGEEEEDERSKEDELDITCVLWYQ